MLQQDSKKKGGIILEVLSISTVVINIRGTFWELWAQGFYRATVDEGKAGISYYAIEFEIE